MRRLWRWWKDWRPLFLWPLSLYLLVSAIVHAAVHDDYARGAFELILSHIVDLSATESAERWLKENPND